MKSKQQMIMRDCDINELRSFIVDSNLEWALIDQSSKDSQPIFKHWLGLDDETELDEAIEAAADLRRKEGGR